MLSTSQLAGLKDPSPVPLASIKRTLLSSATTTEEKCLLVIAALEVVGESALSFRDKGRRAAQLAETLGEDIQSRQFLSEVARQPPAIVNGISSLLSPNHQKLLYTGSSESASSTEPAGTNSRPTIVLESIKASEVVPVQTESVITPEEPLSAETTKNNDSEDAPVILLLSTEEQETNRGRLVGKKFAPFRVKTVEELESQLGQSDICGFVVDGSFWIGQTPEQQKKTLLSIASYSSLAYCVIDARGFTGSASIQKTIADAHLRHPSAGQLRVTEGGRLLEEDLGCFDLSARAIFHAHAPDFVPEDLTQKEVQALSAALTDFHRENFGRTRIPLKTLNFQTIRAGKRGEPKLLLIHFNGENLPVIAKIGPIDTIKSEVDRYTQYIAPHDDTAQPHFTFHGGWGVVISRIVCTIDDPHNPAPTLDAGLRGIWRDDFFGPRDNLAERCSRLLRAVDRVSQRLKNLNSYPCSNPQHSSYAYLSGSGLLNFNASGVRWHFPDVEHGTLDKCIEVAQELLKPAQMLALVHGDPHMENILLRDEGDPWLIDYGYSGPGHPAFDLVRLECALIFRYLRPLGSEAEWQAMQTAISADFCTCEWLKKEYPHWFSSLSNALLLESSLICRDRCIEVLDKYGLTPDDYRAAKFIMCCGSLFVPELQMGFIRGTMQSLMPAFIR